MRKQYDFSKAKRAKDVPHLAKLQTEAKGKAQKVGGKVQREAGKAKDAIRKSVKK